MSSPQSARWVAISSRMRMLRMMLGMSQRVLGAAIGLTVQQVQKYEYGTSRINAWHSVSVSLCSISRLTN